MRGTQTKLAVASLVIVIGTMTFGTTEKANAQCSTGYCQTHVTATVAATETAINAVINSMADQLSTDVARQTADQSKFFQTLAKANVRIERAAMKRDRQLLIDEKRLETAQEDIGDHSRACSVVTSTVDGGIAMARAEQDRFAFADSTQGWLAGTNNYATSQGQQNANEARLAGWGQSYCDMAGYRAGLCTERKVVQAREQGLAGADSNASKSLFAMHSLEDKRAQAADLVIRNAIQNDVKGPVPEDAATTVEGKQILAERKHARAVRSFPAETLAFIKSQRTAATGNGSGVSAGAVGVNASGSDESRTEWARSLAQQLPTLNEKAYEGKLTLDGWRKARVHGWIHNPTWMSEIDQSGQTHILEQMAYMRGYSIWQDYRQQKLMRRMAAQQAVMVDLVRKMEENQAAN